MTRSLPLLALAPVRARERAMPSAPSESRRPVARLVDPALLVAAVVLTALAQPQLFATETLVSLDSASQFYPWYAYLGQGLRAGHVPGWNPATFSGTPFAANPLSGWTYLPAMALFALWPLAQAARLYLAFHPLLAACSTYALARALGVHPAGALLAAVAYANTAYFQVQNACCFAFASVYAWLPATLFGIERGLRAGRWVSRAAWWGAAGFALSQVLAGWLGQGTYYAALLSGGYVLYRTLLVPPGGVGGGPSARLGRCLQHGLGVVLFGTALAAAGLLPRLEFNALSSLAGGYAGAEVSVGGLHPTDWALLATPGFWYAGASVLALAVLAPFLARGPVAGATWYFAATSVAALVLTGTAETPLHWLLYHLVPGFARLHPHIPERILTVGYLGPSLLAGVAVDAVWRRRLWPRGVASSPRRQILASGLLVLVVVADLALGGAKARADYTLTDPLAGAEKLTPVDLATYYAASGAARFLQDRQAEAPVRYVGYAPEIGGRPLPYSTRFRDPGTAALLVDNRALALGLQDVQGYDPSQLARYDAYLVALNGRGQNYHDAEVFREGLGSPLLDLLNARYVVVAQPAAGRQDAFDDAALGRFPGLVYQDEQVRILENPSALPRAWIVHAASQVPPGEALAALVHGGVDPRRTALLEEPPPPLATAADPADDAATVTEAGADRLAVRASTDAPGLLVLSEVYYPGWHAYVDGRPAPVYLADHLLRAVPVPPGEHSVELRFESATLAAGSIISGVALLALIGLFSASAGADRPDRQPAPGWYSRAQR